MTAKPRRQVVIRRASDIPSSTWRTDYASLTAAVNEILPNAWQVLPDGQPAARAIASRAALIYDEKHQSRTSPGLTDKEQP